MIQANLSGVVRSLVLTLRARVDEHQRPDGLFQDEEAANWYPFLPEFEDYEDWYNAPFQLASAIRTRYFDDIARQFIESHDDPVIIELGAGLTTRCYRLGIESARWIHIDLPDAIALRHKFEADTFDHRSIASSIIDPDWVNKLPDSTAKNTLLLAEGVLMFLNQDEIDQLMLIVRQNLSGSTFALDVVREHTRDRMNETFGEVDAPMVWGIEKKEILALGVKSPKIRYLLTEFPERWAEIGIAAESLTEDKSGFVVEAVVKRASR